MILCWTSKIMITVRRMSGNLTHEECSSNCTMPSSNHLWHLTGCQHILQIRRYVKTECGVSPNVLPNNFDSAQLTFKWVLGNVRFGYLLVMFLCRTELKCLVILKTKFKIVKKDKMITKLWKSNPVMQLSHSSTSAALLLFLLFFNFFCLN